MGARKHDRFELMNEREIWMEPAFELFSEKKREVYLARKKAVDMYIDGECLEDINSKTGVDKSHIVKYVDKCLKRDDEGNSAGYIALCPGTRTKNTIDIQENSTQSGEFSRLLGRYEELKPFIEGNYFGYEAYTYEKNTSICICASATCGKT